MPNVMRQLIINLVLLFSCSVALAAPPIEVQQTEAARLFGRGAAAAPAPISPEPPRIGGDPAMKTEQLVELAHRHAKAIQLDENNGKHHLMLADALTELASRVKDLSPPPDRVEANSDLSEERKQEIRSFVNALCIDYDGVKPMVWLVQQGDEAEPFVIERLRKAHDYEKPRLYEVLSTHWRNLAIQHYALAHNLSWKQDIAAYNPAFGEPWDKFTALRAGKLYLQMTAWRKDDESQRQAARVRETFAVLRKKQSEYKGPVR